MPRSLARLRYSRKLPVPVVHVLPNLNPKKPQEVHERQLLAHVSKEARPRPFGLQVVLNPKARRPATGQYTPPPRRPYTLRDVVDPEGTSQHGEIIYIFRNTKTNQVIYSLQELLANHHLEQLPFIGRHSKPPALRPDEWIPHCVLTFPTAEQGHNAYRKLREFRKLHELSWDKTNPEWKTAPIKVRMKNIMDQRANTSADIAEVLRIQELHGEQMQAAVDERQAKVTEFMDKKWADIDALANAAKAKAKETDNVKWLEHQIRSLTLKANMKHNQNDADQKRLTKARIIQEIRLRKLQYAQRKTDQLKTVQEELTRRAAPAEEWGAEGKLDELKEQASALKESLAIPDGKIKDRADKRNLLARHESEITALEGAFAAQAQLEARDNPIALSVLPTALKKILPTPYTLDGLSIRWADIQDALYAAGQWPEPIEHEVLEVNKARNEVMWFSIEDAELDRWNKVDSILQAVESERVRKEEELAAEAAA